MTRDCSHVGWKFLLLWVLACTVGWIGGFIVASVGVSAGVMVLPVGLLVAGILAGTGVGIMQWLCLRYIRISWANRWILASAVGAVIGAILGDVMGFVGFGIGVGFMQWLVLRRRVLGAGWWVLGCSMGFIMAGRAAEVLADPTSFSGQAVEGFVGFGAVVGIITGGALLWLLRHPVKAAERNAKQSRSL